MSQQSVQTWFYHSTDAPDGEIFDLSTDPALRAEQVSALEKDGWVDTPVKFQTTKKNTK